MIHPFFLGVAATVAAKPILRATYKGAAAIKVEAEKLAEQARAELKAKELARASTDPEVLQATIAEAVAKAVAEAMAKQKGAQK